LGGARDRQFAQHSQQHQGGLYVVNNTMAARDGGSFEMVVSFSNVSSVADAVIGRNNILIADDSGSVNNWMSGLARFDFDSNLYFRRGGSPVIYRINNQTDCTLPQWQLTSGSCGSGEDLNSLFVDPLVVADSDVDFNARLRRQDEGGPLDSPAIDAGMEMPYTPPSFVPPEVLPDGGAVVGTTRLDNAPDDVGTNMDIGVHYPTRSAPDDLTPPTITFVSPDDGARFPAYTRIQIVATVTDDRDPVVPDVELQWTNNGATTIMTCPSSTTNWSCAVSGSTYTWSINVGEGTRQYLAKATDSFGNTTTSPQRTLYLDPADTTPPAITIVSPNDGATLRAYSTIQIVATVTDNRDADVMDVKLLWTNNGITTTMPCPSSTPNWSCTKSGSNRTWSINVGEGQRLYRIEATDSSSNTATTPQRTVYLVPGL
jgi:hypothetical protein